MARRAAGEGSIYPVRNKAGHIVRWASAITIYVDGKARRKKVERKLKRDVQEELHRLRRQQASGMDVTTRPQLLKTFLPAWLDDDYALRGRATSIATYRWACEKVIVPQLGSIHIAKLTHQRCQQWVNGLTKEDLAPASIHLAATVLRQALKTAKKWHLVESNVAEGLTLPRIPPTSVHSLLPDQCRAFLEAARGEYHEIALRLTLSLGLRCGETCGLRWEDYDARSGYLIVNGTVTKDETGARVYGEPKTPKGRRAVKLPPAIQTALAWHREQQRQEREWRELGESVYIFTAEKSGGMLNPACLAAVFKRVAVAAGMSESVHIHMLRHSCASFLIAQGVPLTVVSGVLGHASIAITASVYAHLLPGQVDAALEKVEALIGDATPIATLSA